MASTEQRTGFRLPWAAASSGGPGDAPADESTASEGDGAEASVTAAAQTPSEPPAAEAVPASAAMASEPEIDPGPEEATDRPAPARWQPGPAPATEPPVLKPNRFLADLARAMRSAAEASRTSTLEAFRQDAKAYVEGIHARSAAEAEQLRQAADEDIGGVKDWSKTEIARIRAETEERIADRRLALERDLDGHAALIEGKIDHVQTRVSEYEAEMDAFFERLEAIDDPGRFAAVAAQVPDPPTFGEPEGDGRGPAVEIMAAAEAVHEGAPAIEPATAAAPSAPTPEADEPTLETSDAVEAVEPAPDDIPAEDPRLAALGLSPDDAAEGESQAAEEAFPELDEARIAARLGDTAAVAPVTVGSATTNVIVVGLVSVASIASFKRHLAKLTGVQSVGVSSGPDGEFVFKAVHDQGLALQEAVTMLPGFGARVVASADGVLNVSARDPESES